MSDFWKLAVFCAVLLAIASMVEVDRIRIFLGFIPIFVIVLALIYSRIQAQLKILLLVVRNILKAAAKQRLNSTPDSHQAAFISTYRGHLLKVLLLMIILAFVSYQLTLLISPLLLIHSKDIGEILGAVFISGTLYAIAFYLLCQKNSFQLPEENLKAVGTAAVLLLLGASFFFGVEAFLVVTGLEIFVFDWIHKKNKSR